MHVGSEVVDPQLFGPRFFLSRLVLQEQHVGFDALGGSEPLHPIWDNFARSHVPSRRQPHVLGVHLAQDAGGQAEQSVDVALLEQVRADGLSGSSLEERKGNTNLH